MVKKGIGNTTMKNRVLLHAQTSIVGHNTHLLWTLLLRTFSLIPACSFSCPHSICNNSESGKYQARSEFHKYIVVWVAFKCVARIMFKQIDCVVFLCLRHTRLRPMTKSWACSCEGQLTSRFWNWQLQQEEWCSVGLCYWTLGPPFVRPFTSFTVLFSSVPLLTE